MTTLSLCDPKDTLTLAEVATAANLAVTKNIYTTTSGDLVSLKQASICERWEREAERNVRTEK